MPDRAADSAPDAYDLRGRVVVVTGASLGIGRSVASAAHRHGAHVVLVGRRRDRLDELAELLGGRRVTSCAADVTEPGSVAAAAALVRRELGGADALVNSAGLPATRAALEQDEHEWDAVLRVNLSGTFHTCQAFAPQMIDKWYGKIVNMSSTWSIAAGVGKAAYGAAKAGVNQLTRVLALEWAPHGVRVNAVAPTTTATESREDILRSSRGRELLARIPLGRFAVPDDVAGTVLFLLSPSSDFVTGTVVEVDGGRLLS